MLSLAMQGSASSASSTVRPLLGILLCALALALIILFVAICIRRLRQRPVIKTPTAAPADPFASDDPIAGSNPEHLRVGDVVEWLGQSYAVRGIARFNNGGYRWTEYFLDTGAGMRRWLTVEHDPDLRVTVWEDRPNVQFNPRDTLFGLDRVMYRRKEAGTARYTYEGTTDLPHQEGTVEYVDFEGPDEHYLSQESYDGGSTWYVSTGTLVAKNTLRIYPQTSGWTSY